MAGPARQRIVPVLVLSGAACVLATVVVFVFTRGLGAADQLSSVVAGAIGLATLAWWAIGFSRRGQQPRLAEFRTTWGTLRGRPEFAGFVAAQVRAASALPYRVPGFGAVPMAEIYVRQDLETRAARTGSVAVEAQPHERLEARSAGQLQIRMLPLAERVEQVLSRHQHLLVEGGPGLGKSSLARSLTMRIGRQWQDESADTVLDAPVVPVLVSARALARHRDEPWSVALAGACGDELGLYADAAPTADLFDDPPAGGGFLLLVDRLDEVTEPQRRDLIEVLAERMAMTGSRYRIVVFTRPLDGSARDRFRLLGAGVYTMLPFSQTAVEDFVAGVFGADTSRAGRFLDQLRSADLDEVAATPLLATIAVTVFASRPEHGLPASQYELYEQYLAHLRDVNADRRRRLRVRLRERDPEAVRQIDALFDHAAELVEHLAVRQVETNDSLLQAALAWCEAHLPPGLPAAASRADLIADVLASTGLLVRRERDLLFIHHTFAEHFQADHHAAQLPVAFDPASPAWRAWIDRAFSGDETAHSVLVRWTRRASGHDLLDWLQTGPLTYQLLAVTLIGEGAATAQRHVAAALAYLDRACETWITDENLDRRLRRLPDGPTVRAWALSVLGRAGTPGALMAAAVRFLAAADAPVARTATALLRARLDDNPLPVRRAVLAQAMAGLADDAEAVAVLTAALRDDLATADERGRVARALMELGPPSRVRVRDELCHLVCSKEVDAAGRAAVARVLAELDAGWRDEASAVVQTALEDGCTIPSERLMLGRLLAELGVDLALAARTLLGIAGDVYADGLDRITAARIAADLSPEHRRTAAAALHALAIDPWQESWHRRILAERVVELGAEQHETVALAARAVLTERGIRSVWDFRYAAQVLLRLPTGYYAESLALLATQPGSPDSRTAMVAAARAVLDSASLPEAAETLRRIAEDRFAKLYTRNEAACMLAELGPDVAPAGRQILLEIARHDRQAWRRAYSAYWLAIEYPSLQQESAGCLIRAVADPRPSTVERLNTAFYLLEAVREGRSLGIARLHAALAAPRTGTLDSTFVAERIARETRSDRFQVIETCNAIAADPAASVASRVDACSELLRWRPADRKHAVAVLGAMCRDPHLPAQERVLSAERLASVPAGRDQAVAVLTLLCDDPHTPAGALVAANALLDQFGSADRLARIGIARAVLADPYASPTAHVAAIDWLGRVGTTDAGDTGRLCELAGWLSDEAVLRSVARAALPHGEDCTAAVAGVLRERLDGDIAECRAVAAALAELGGEHETVAADELARRLGDRCCPSDVVQIARTLATLTTTGRRAAADALERLLARVDVEIDHQVEAVDCLAGIAATAGSAVTHARRLLTDLRLQPGHVLRLAEICVDLEPGDRTARDRLRGLLDDPATARAAVFALAAAEPKRFADLDVPAASAVLGYATAASELVARLDERHAPAAVQTLAAATGQGGWAGRWPAVTALTELRLGRQPATEALARMLEEPDLTVRDQCRIARLLATLGAAGRDRGAAQLIHMLNGRRLGPRSTRTVTAALAQFGPVYRDIAAGHLLATQQRVAAAAELATLSPAYQRQAAKILREELSGPARLAAATRLATISPPNRAAAAAVLLDGARLGGPRSVWAASELVRHRHPGWPEAAGLLRRYHSGPGHLRRQAAQGLLAAGPDANQDALTMLGTICADAAVHPHDRLEAALTLTRHADNADAAVAALAVLAADTQAPRPSAGEPP